LIAQVRTKTLNCDDSIPITRNINCLAGSAFANANSSVSYVGTYVGSIIGVVFFICGVGVFVAYKVRLQRIEALRNQERLQGIYELLKRDNL
jgi:hypothetical protein